MIAGLLKQVCNAAKMLQLNSDSAFGSTWGDAQKPRLVEACSAIMASIAVTNPILIWCHVFVHFA